MIRCATNPLLVFLAVWGMAITLYLGGVVAGLFPAPHALTVGALALNLGAFSLGYLTWARFQGPTPPRLEPLRVARLGAPQRADAQPALAKSLQRALAFTLLMGVSALFLMLYRVTQIAARSGTGVFELFANPPLLRLQLIEFIEMSAWKVSPTIMLTSLTSGFFAMGFILLGVFLRLDATARRYAYLGGFLFVGLVTCLVNLSRYDMTICALYLVLAYCVTASATRTGMDRRFLWDLLPAAMGVVIIFVAVEMLLHKSATYGPAGEARSVLFSFYWYLASPIAAFNDYLANFAGAHTLGERTLAPFFKWLHRFHVIAPHTFLISGEFIFIPYPVNVYTYLRSIYEDFGLVGVAVMPYVYGVLMAAVRGPAQRRFPYLNLYVLLLVPLMFSFFHYWLLSSQFYLQILFGFIFFRYEIEMRESRR